MEPLQASPAVALSRYMVRKNRDLTIPFGAAHHTGRCDPAHSGRHAAPRVGLPVCLQRELPPVAAVRRPRVNPPLPLKGLRRDTHVSLHPQLSPSGRQVLVDPKGRDTHRITRATALARMRA